MGFMGLLLQKMRSCEPAAHKCFHLVNTNTNAPEDMPPLPVAVLGDRF